MHCLQGCKQDAVALPNLHVILVFDVISCTALSAVYYASFLVVFLGLFPDFRLVDAILALCAF